MPITVQAAAAAVAERDNALVGADAAFRSTTAETAKKGTHPEFGLTHVCEADYARQIAEIDSERYHHLQSKITGKKLAEKKRDADIDIALLKSLGRRLATIRDSVRDFPGNSLPECEAALQLMHRMVDDHEDRRLVLSGRLLMVPYADACKKPEDYHSLVTRRWMADDRDPKKLHGAIDDIQRSSQLNKFLRLPAGENSQGSATTPMARYPAPTAPGGNKTQSKGGRGGKGGSKRNSGSGGGSNASE